MSKIVSKILKQCNSDTKKLNILIHEFDIETELEISKTGHNFYRVNILGNDEDRYTENFFILPKQQILFCIDYDMLIIKNGHANQEFLNDIGRQLQLPLLIIDEERSMKSDVFALTNLSDKNEDGFVDKWNKLLQEFKEVYIK